MEVNCVCMHPCIHTYSRYVLYVYVYVHVLYFAHVEVSGVTTYVRTYTRMNKRMSVQGRSYHRGNQCTLKFYIFRMKKAFIMAQINFSQFSVTIWFKFDILS